MYVTNIGFFACLIFCILYCENCLEFIHVCKLVEHNHFLGPVMNIGGECQVEQLQVTTPPLAWVPQLLVNPAPQPPPDLGHPGTDTELVGDVFHCPPHVQPHGRSVSHSRSQRTQCHPSHQAGWIHTPGMKSFVQSEQSLSIRHYIVDHFKQQVLC